MKNSEGIKMEEKINKNSNLKKELKHTNLKNTDKRKLQAGEKEKSSEHCPYAKKCGGCDYQGFSYKKQLEKKQVICESSWNRLER